MKKLLLTLILLSIFACNDKKEKRNRNLNSATEEKSNFTKIFKGKIDDKYPITMELITENNMVSGKYKYDKSGIPITIKGAIINDSIFLNGFNPGGEKIDIFKGQLKNSILDGTWYGLTNNNKFNFHLKEKKIDSSSFQKTLQEDSNEKHLNNRDPNFPIIEFLEAGFAENIPEFRYEGSSFKLKMRMKNNTSNQIRRFNLKYYIKVIMQDGTYAFYPASFFGDANDNLKKFNSYDIMRYEIPYETVWEPNEVKTIVLTVPQDIVAGFNCNFPKSTFERTPTEAIIAYKYEAISVEEEYQRIESYNILKFWKKYQKEIGLR